MHQFRLAAIIPTRNRPVELRALLKSLEQQSRPPDRVIIVDGSDEAFRSDNRDAVNDTDLRCDWQAHWPPSAAAQRNAGLDLALAETDLALVGLFDDDLTLGQTAIENACLEIARSDDVYIGFGFNPTDSESMRGHSRLKQSSLASSLGLYSAKAGAVSPSGWHTRLVKVTDRTEVQWLISGAAIWRTDAIRQFRFDEYFERYSYLEDLEFSLQARATGRFLVLPAATYFHTPAKDGRGSGFWFGRIEVRNRYYIVRKHHLSRWRFWLGTAIRAGITLAAGLRYNVRELTRFLGNVAGVTEIGIARLSGKA